MELAEYPKEGPIETRVDELSDSDVQQVSGKNYDPTPDKRDMRRLGKRQELKVRFDGYTISRVTQQLTSFQRRFRFFSIVGYVIVLGLTWEFSLVLSIFSLANGGTAGAIWLTFTACCGMGMIMLSMAEMA